MMCNFQISYIASQNFYPLVSGIMSVHVFEWLTRLIQHGMGLVLFMPSEGLRWRHLGQFLDNSWFSLNLNFWEEEDLMAIEKQNA